MKSRIEHSAAQGVQKIGANSLSREKFAKGEGRITAGQVAGLCGEK